MGFVLAVGCCRYQRTRQLQESLRSDGSSHLSSIDRIMYNQYWTDVGRERLNFYQAQANFFSAMADAHPDPYTILHHGHHIAAIRRRTQELFDKLLALDSNSLKACAVSHAALGHSSSTTVVFMLLLLQVLRAYGTFQDEIMHDTDAAVETYRKADRIELSQVENCSDSLSLRDLSFGMKMGSIVDGEEQAGTLVLSGHPDRYAPRAGSPCAAGFPSVPLVHLCACLRFRLLPVLALCTAAGLGRFSR